MKRIVSLLLMLAMMLSIISVASFAVAEEPVTLFP